MQNNSIRRNQGTGVVDPVVVEPVIDEKGASTVFVRIACQIMFTFYLDWEKLA